MGLIVIPSDFVEGVSRIVPIYIQDHDPKGKPIAPGWIHAAARVAGGLRWLSREFLQDEWRASELADETVQDLSGKHGDRLGERPHDQVFTHARWKALDKSVGGIRARKGLDVELLEHILHTLQEPRDFAEDVEVKLLLDRLIKRLSDLGLNDVQKTLELALHNGDFEFLSEIGESRNTVSKRFWRAIRKVARML
jgi:hypothetical protein